MQNSLFPWLSNDEMCPLSSKPREFFLKKSIQSLFCLLFLQGKTEMTALLMDIHPQQLPEDTWALWHVGQTPPVGLLSLESKIKDKQTNLLMTFLFFFKMYFENVLVGHVFAATQTWQRDSSLHLKLQAQKRVLKGVEKEELNSSFLGRQHFKNKATMSQMEDKNM